MNLPENMNPLAVMSARIGWRVVFSEIIFDDPPYLVMQSIPNVPFLRADLPGCGVVWDVQLLIQSARRPGAYYLITSECGYAEDAGIKEVVLVSHPDEHTIIWELDIDGFREVLDVSHAAAPSGFIRLIFQREEYELDARSMAIELQRAARQRFSAHSGTDDYGLQSLLREYDYSLPHDSEISVEELEPNINGLALERLAELDTNTIWGREPLWSAETLVEFGFFLWGDGHELIRFNGKCNPACWPGWYFTRWQALEAFNDWLSFVQRAFWVYKGTQMPCGTKTNEFVLLRETDRVMCHNAGRRLAEVVQWCCSEGKTAPNVTIWYVELPIHSAG